MFPVLLDNAVVANEFLTCLTVKFKFFAMMQGAVEGYPFQCIQLFHLLLKLYKGDNFVF